MNISDGTRSYLSEMRALAIDEAGNEHLVGLTLEESVFLIAHGDTRMSGHGASRENRSRYLELSERHERARIAVLAAEIQMRVDRPQIQ